ncbi:MBL fold metallo-hydrolase [Spiractinospora alimapuensis]|uniref:MBL fold metallo-hydrolase n=1 Tax=Spiractinospora alimapuensis TaxID=2820884 RepID=UPI001F27B2AC|nr:MBL fold metallo-hydrolase [Spiractinospora alimapuensis]QVQ51214.1 MBL fold metallo-hydrolase [Spiractinospora alimapuensis]
MEVVTLGVAAGPAIRTPEAGIATAVVVNGQSYLVDFGIGCTRAARTAGLTGRDFRAGFVTHLHSDHVAELPAFLLWNWGRPVDGFTTPFTVHGPAPDPREGRPRGGTKAMVRSVLDAFSYDIAVRTEDEGRPPLDSLVRVHEITPTDTSGPIPVYTDEHVTVTAVLVEHPPVFPAFAFRFDTADASVTLSGDTAECEALVELAGGTDVLIHEAVALDYYRDRGFDSAFLRHQERSHTTPQGAGRIARRAGARRLVLSHLAGIAPPEYWRRSAEETFDGPVSVASSGDRFVVSPPSD